MSHMYPLRLVAGFRSSRRSLGLVCTLSGGAMLFGLVGGCGGRSNFLGTEEEYYLSAAGNGDGDGDGDYYGDGDLPGDGDYYGDGDLPGDGDYYGDGDISYPGDGDGDFYPGD